MRLTSEGEKFLKREEGYRSHMYRDIRGVGTIGWGHVVLPDDDFGVVITKDRAQELFESDVNKAERSINRLVKAELLDHQWDALVSWVFNLGGGKLATSTLRKVINAGRLEEAPKQIKRWVYAGDRDGDGDVDYDDRVKALEDRRNREAKLWMTGDYGLS